MGLETLFIQCFSCSLLLFLFSLFYSLYTTSLHRFFVMLEAAYLRLVTVHFGLGSATFGLNQQNVRFRQPSNMNLNIMFRLARFSSAWKTFKIFDKELVLILFVHSPLIMSHHQPCHYQPIASLLNNAAQWASMMFNIVWAPDKLFFPIRFMFSNEMCTITPHNAHHHTIDMTYVAHHEAQMVPNGSSLHSPGILHGMAQIWVGLCGIS